MEDLKERLRAFLGFSGTFLEVSGVSEKKTRDVSGAFQVISKSFKDVFEDFIRFLWTFPDFLKF